MIGPRNHHTMPRYPFWATVSRDEPWPGAVPPVHSSKAHRAGPSQPADRLADAVNTIPVIQPLATVNIAQSRGDYRGSI